MFSKGQTTFSTLWRIAITVVFISALGFSGWYANKTIPAQHLPWKPLDTSRPLGWATKAQISRLQLSPSATCMDLARDTAGLESIPSNPKKRDDVCGWDIARVMYGQDDVIFAPGESNMQCPLSIASYLWVREVDAIAQRRFGQGLSKVHHMGTYSCRRMRGNGSGKWSEHAFANAWDVAAFEFQDGTRIDVLNGWDGPYAESSFLREVRDVACDIFNVTLSPNYNAAHADHFHLDMGPSRSCR